MCRDSCWRRCVSLLYPASINAKNLAYPVSSRVVSAAVTHTGYTHARQPFWASGGARPSHRSDPHESLAGRRGDSSSRRAVTRPRRDGDRQPPARGAANLFPHGRLVADIRRRADYFCGSTHDAGGLGCTVWSGNDYTTRYGDSHHEPPVLRDRFVVYDKLPPIVRAMIPGDGRIYVGNRDGDTFVISAGPTCRL